MSTFAIGDEVALPQGHKAILRWIGRIPGRQPIEYAGVEVVGPQAALLGKHSGTYEGKRYFETQQPGAGLFVSYTQLVSANVRTPRLAPPSASPRFADDSFRPASPRSQHSPRPLSVHGQQSPRPHSQSPRAASPLHQFGREFGRDNREAREFTRELTRDYNRELLAASPRFHKPPMPDTSAGQSVGSSGQRDFFRNALRATNTKVAELQAAFEARIAELTASYEQKLGQARRTSLASPASTEVEEQRQALASMQNKLINERAEKQDEIDTLKRELQHMRRLGGSAEDLEQLVGDLGRYEQQLAELRSQVMEMDAVKAEVERLRSQNATLEFAARAGPRGSASSEAEIEARLRSELHAGLEAKMHAEFEAKMHTAVQDEVAAKLEAARTDREAALSDREAALADREAARTDREAAESLRKAAELAREETARLERQLEAKVVRESELEALTEQLQAELHAKHSETKAPGTTETTETTTPKPAIPVPESLATYDESSILDLAAGRSDWCSLCEREGHTAVDCPYE